MLLETWGKSGLLYGLEKMAGDENRYRVRAGECLVIYVINGGPRLVPVAVLADDLPFPGAVVLAATGVCQGRPFSETTGK